MPRPHRRLVLGLAHHIVQRGHGRQPVFDGPAAYRSYLHDLCRLAKQQDVAVHAWCLMGNHVHLLLNPLRDAQAIPLLMKTLSGQATRRHNRRHDRSGSLWEARYRCRLVDTTEYLLRCCCYIERNPVEAGLAGHPASYPWSSYRLRMGMGGEGCFTPDMVYLALGNTEAERRAVYRGWIQRA